MCGCGILTGSDGIREASHCQIALPLRASRKIYSNCGGIRRVPKISVSLKFVCRLRLVAIHRRDPCGIPTGSDGIGWELASVNVLNHAFRFKRVAIYERDRRGSRAGSNGIRGDPRGLVLLELVCRVRLVAIYRRDQCGIRTGSDGVRWDVATVVCLKFTFLLKLVPN